MVNNFFSKLDNNVRSYVKFLEHVTDRTSASYIELDEKYVIKATLVKNYLQEIIDKNRGDSAQIAINNLGGQAEGVIKTTSARSRENIEADLDIIMNFLGQVAAEIFIREEMYIGDAGQEMINFFYFSEHRTNQEKYLGMYFTGKLPLLIYSEKQYGTKDSLAGKLSEIEVKVDYFNSKFDGLEKLKEGIDELSIDLEKKKFAFRFLGLSAAFKEFNRNKTWSMTSAFILMLLLAATLICIPFYAYQNANKFHTESTIEAEIKRIDDNISRSSKKLSTNQIKELKDISEKLDKIVDKDKNRLLTKYFINLLPILGVEILLFYFFRLVYQSYANSRSQKMQLQMRNSLCQFIESYIKYKKENKESESTFDKFESHIFSGLSPNDEKVPSTFDGLEQIAKMVKEIKG